VNDESFDLRLTRGAALRLAAAAAAGLALGARSARAAPVVAVDAVEAAARAFLASLSPAQRARASFPFGGAERTRWHWTVPTSVPRNGLPLGQMSIRQRRVALALLRVSTSNAGYSKARDIMSLQGVLQRMTTGINDPFDADRYFVSVFGRPGDRAWGWRLEGHHLSRNFTIVGDTLVAEPFFLGAWPTRAGTAYRTIAQGERAMRREEDAAREIVLSVDGRLRRRVVFSSESLTDHVTQNAVRVRPLDPVGVPATSHPPRKDACSRSCAPMSRTTPRRLRGERSIASSEPAWPASASAGPEAFAQASPTTTGCKGPRFCSSSTTRATAARTSTASGATSSATTAATCSDARPLARGLGALLRRSVTRKRRPRLPASASPTFG
jgi:hypothetical protein